MFVRVVWPSQYWKEHSRSTSSNSNTWIRLIGSSKTTLQRRLAQPHQIGSSKTTPQKSPACHHHLCKGPWGTCTSSTHHSDKSPRPNIFRKFAKCIYKTSRWWLPKYKSDIFCEVYVLSQLRLLVLCCVMLWIIIYSCIGTYQAIHEWNWYLPYSHCSYSCLWGDTLDSGVFRTYLTLTVWYLTRYTSDCRHLSICSHVVISVPICDIPPHSQSFIFVNEVCTCIGGTFSCMQYLSDYYCWHDI